MAQLLGQMTSRLDPFEAVRQTALHRRGIDTRQGARAQADDQDASGRHPDRIRSGQVIRAGASMRGGVVLAPFRAAAAGE